MATGNMAWMLDHPADIYKSADFYNSGPLQATA
jgi:hypothetical protein